MGWGMVIWIGLQLIAALISLSMSKSNQVTKKPGEVDGTTIDSASPVPILFGTRLMIGANLAWYGHVKTEPIVKEGGKK